MLFFCDALNSDNTPNESSGSYNYQIVKEIATQEPVKVISFDRKKRNKRINSYGKNLIVLRHYAGESKEEYNK